MIKNYLIPILFFVVGTINANAQLSHGGKPLSFTHALLKKASVFRTPVLDYQKLIDEEKNDNRNIKPYRYGKNHEVKLSPDSSGTWTILSNGEKIWQLRIYSEQAYSLSLIFDKFRLNPGVKMFLFSPDRKIIIGSFTGDNNKSSGKFATSAIPGDEVVLEIDVPGDTEIGEIEISGIVHDYKNAFGLKTGFGDAGYCNVNINCPEGAEWQKEKRSVVRFSYVAGFAELCTGVFVNNTAYDTKPYLLTANHCVSSQGVANTTIFYFNYESENCVATVEPSYQTLSSAELISTGGNLDFTLMQLNENPPASYNVYFSGWNRISNPALKTVTIHHPQGDIKKISMDNDPPVTGDFPDGYLDNSHWQILHWDLGTTEGGSSGSPLYDENHRIVGDLSGGYAYCQSNFDDFYQKFNYSWDYNPETNKQLKAWLDPLNTGAEVLDGYDPNAVSVGTDISVIQVKTPNGSYCAGNETIPTLVIQNKGSVDLTSAILNYRINGGSIISKVWSGNLKPNETTDFSFDVLSVPSGNCKFLTFSSAPNGIADVNNNNDTARIDFTGENLLTEVNITGKTEICNQSLYGSYSTISEGNYRWNVEGGSIQGLDTLQSVNINWNEWGERKVFLQISNLCNYYDAEPLIVKVVEQSVEIKISTGNNASSACCIIKDCEGNTIYEKCNFEDFKTYTEDLCLNTGCYSISFYSENDGITSYKLTNKLNAQTITEGFSLVGSATEQFNLDPSVNLAEFNVYPNPSKSEIVIEASYSELYTDSKFAIFNLKGAMVTPFEILDSRKEIDISKLQQGMYLIEILSSNGKFTLKFVKP